LTEIDVVIIKIQIGSETKPGFLPTRIHYPQFLVEKLIVARHKTKMPVMAGER
jgi:hypothetical protein